MAKQKNTLLLINFFIVWCFVIHIGQSDQTDVSSWYKTQIIDTVFPLYSDAYTTLNDKIVQKLLTLNIDSDETTIRALVDSLVCASRKLQNQLTVATKASGNIDNLLDEQITRVTLSITNQEHKIRESQEAIDQVNINIQHTQQQITLAEGAVRDKEHTLNAAEHNMHEAQKPLDDDRLCRGRRRKRGFGIQWPKHVEKPVVRHIVVKPVVRHTVVKPVVRHTVVKPVVRHTVVKPVVPHTVVKPVVPHTVVKPVVRHTVVKPVVRHTVVKPVVPHTVVKPVVRHTVVKPVVHHTIVKPVCRVINERGIDNAKRQRALAEHSLHEAHERLAQYKQNFVHQHAQHAIAQTKLNEATSQRNILTTQLHEKQAKQRVIALLIKQLQGVAIHLKHVSDSSNALANAISQFVDFELVIAPLNAIYQEMITNDVMASFTFKISAEMTSQVLKNLKVLSDKMSKMPLNEMIVENISINCT